MSLVLCLVKQGAVQHPVAYALGDSLRNTSYGPHRDNISATTAEHNSCWSQDATNMWGDDLKPSPTGVTSADGCCAACEANSKCKFWTFQYALPGQPGSHASHCDLKTGSSGYRRFQGTISGGPGSKPGNLPPLPPPPGPANFTGPVAGLPEPDLNNRRCGDGHNGIKDQSSAMCTGSTIDGRLTITLPEIKRRCGLDARCIGFTQDGPGPAPSGYFRPFYFCECILCTSRFYLVVASAMCTYACNPTYWSANMNLSCTGHLLQILPL